MDVLGVVAGAAAIGFVVYAIATRKNKHGKSSGKGDHDHHVHHHEDHNESSAASFGGRTTKSRRRRRRKAWR